MSITVTIKRKILLGEFSTVAQVSDPSGVYFRPDGTRMFVTGSSSDRVYQYDLSTAWDVTSATSSATSNSFAHGNDLEGLFFRPDGNDLFLVAPRGGNCRIYTEYLGGANANGPWDVTGFPSLGFTLVGDFCRGIYFKPDGTRAFVIDDTNNQVEERDVDPAWDNGFSLGNTFSLTPYDASPSGVALNSTGTKMYISGLENAKVYIFSLSTPWDSTTASLVKEFDVSNRTSTPHDVFVMADESAMFIPEQDQGRILKYRL